MPREPRIKAPDQIYSVVTRINNSHFHFLDRKISISFLDHLKKVKEKLKFKLYAFVIMSSHVHLLIQSNDEIADISVIMKHLNGDFAVKFNRKFALKGHFWMERFKSKIVQDVKYLTNTIIYFALNPVRAGIVTNPLNYEFNSIRKIKDEGLFKDIIDDLPDVYNQSLLNFLKRESFLVFVDKLAFAASRYSFNLRKTKREQFFKNFIGGYNFIKNGVFSIHQKNI